MSWLFHRNQISSGPVYKHAVAANREARDRLAEASKSTALIAAESKAEVEDTISDMRAETKARIKRNDVLRGVLERNI